MFPTMDWKQVLKIGAGGRHSCCGLMLDWEDLLRGGLEVGATPWNWDVEGPDVSLLPNSPLSDSLSTVFVTVLLIVLLSLSPSPETPHYSWALLSWQDKLAPLGQGPVGLEVDFPPS